MERRALRGLRWLLPPPPPSLPPPPPLLARPAATPSMPRAATSPCTPPASDGASAPSPRTAALPACMWPLSSQKPCGTSIAAALAAASEFAGWAAAKAAFASRSSIAIAPAETLS